MYSASIKKLIDLFAKFPTIGPRTAARFVFYLMRLGNQEIDNLVSAILDLKKSVKICKSCFNLFSGQNDICQICANSRRDKTLLCVVEKETDLTVLEKTKKYQGFYFILGVAFGALKKSGIEKLRVKELEQKIKNNPEIEEIIIAVNPTTEGEATALYLERLLKPYDKKITRLGRGLPTGGELEYSDEETLGAAFEGRK